MSAPSSDHEGGSRPRPPSPLADGGLLPGSPHTGLLSLCPSVPTDPLLVRIAVLRV